MTKTLQLRPPELPSGGQVSPVPRLDEKFLRIVRESGFRRIGVIAALIEEGRIMMLRHCESDKALGGAWGPLAETSKAVKTSGGWHPEDPVRTLRRAIHEEVGTQVGFPPLQARALGGFTMATWPIGRLYPDQAAYAIVPVLHMEQGSAERILQTFAPNQEVDKVDMLTPDEIRAKRCRRPGVLTWLQVVEHSPLFDGNGPFVPLPAAAALPYGEPVDIIFENMDL